MTLPTTFLSFILRCFFNHCSRFKISACFSTLFSVSDECIFRKAFQKAIAVSVSFRLCLNTNLGPSFNVEKMIKVYESSEKLESYKEPERRTRTSTKDIFERQAEIVKQYISSIPEFKEKIQVKIDNRNPWNLQKFLANERFA